MSIPHLAPSASPPQLSRNTPGLAVAHGLWAGALTLGAATVLGLALPGAQGLAIALLAAAVPGLIGAFLLRSRETKTELTLVGLWALACALAVLATGGLSGPFGAWLVMPLAVAAAIDRPRILARAAAFSLIALVLTAIAPALGLAGAEPPRQTARLMGAIAVASTVASLACGLILSRRAARARTAQANNAAAVREELLAGQPHLLLMVNRLGDVSLYGGTPPPGVQLDLLVERGLRSLVAEEDWSVIDDALGQAIQAGLAQAAFAPLHNPEGWLDLDLKSRGDGRLVATLRDSSAAHARLETAESGRREAEGLAAGRARFLANMSHELRTPLNAIMGFSDIMRNRMFGELPGKYGEYADLIHDSGAHLLDLINDVLDMSKIEARRFELSREILDPREPVSAALRILRLQADDAGIALRASLPSETLEADADRRALKQIVLNLVSNALKFTQRGGVISVTLAGHGDNLELSVTDNGAGIAADDLERLGRPYEQAGDNDRRAKGTGLGLSLVRAFAELHGGEMVIESTLGEGTSVLVRMPVLIASPDKPALPTGTNVIAFGPRP